MQPGYQPAGEALWWWKVAQHLDDAQLAIVNALAHNADDPSAIHALQDRVREGQALLLEIFRAKGLLPRAGNGIVTPPPPSAQPPAPPPPLPGIPSPVGAALAADEPAVPEADQAAASEDPAEDRSSTASAAPAAPAVETVASPETMAETAIAADPQAPIASGPDPSGAAG